MPVHTAKELFVRLLSGLRQGSERGTKVYRELSKIAEDPDIKEALEARALVSDQTLERLDQCFNLIGEQPLKVSSRLQEVFLEEFHKELAEIQEPMAKRLFVLTRAAHLNHLRVAEYMTLVAAADLTGHFGVGVLLETCLADRLAFAERTRRFIRNLVEMRVAKKMSERVAA